jgi:hypothetical protein
VSGRGIKVSMAGWKGRPKKQPVTDEKSGDLSVTEVLQDAKMGLEVRERDAMTLELQAGREVMMTLI